MSRRRKRSSTAFFRADQFRRHIQTYWLRFELRYNAGTPRVFAVHVGLRKIEPARHVHAVRVCGDKKNTACAILAVARAHRYTRHRTTKLPAAAVLCIAARRQKKRWLRNDERSFSFLFPSSSPSNPAVRSDDAKHRIRLRYAFARIAVAKYISNRASIIERRISTKSLEVLFWE